MSIGIRTVKALLDDDAGQGLVEYALIISLVSLVMILSLRYIATHTKSQLSSAANNLS